MSPKRAGSVSFADVVICTDRSMDDAFHVGSRPGLVAEERKRDVRVVYVIPDRSIWLPRTALRTATDAEAARSPLPAAARLAHLLSASGLEAASPEEGTLRVVLRHGGLTPGVIDAIRAELGTALAGWRIRPGGMHRIESVFDLRAGE
jgi:hypothetical protein